MRLIAVGDIHGHLEKLEKLLQIIRPTKKDRLVFLGDYIDRGPDSAGVVECLIQLEENCPQTVFLRGNHEQMMLDAFACDEPDRLQDWKRLSELDAWYRMETRDQTDLECWLNNDGRETLASYGADKDKILKHSIPWHLIPQSHIDFLSRTKFWHRQDGFLFAHAGADEERPLENQIVTLLWERYCPTGKTEIHVVGHQTTPDGKPYFEPGRYSLDTGAAYGRALTACNVLTREFWQVLAEV